ALVYHFRIGREAGWFWRVGVPGLWFAATILSKASGLVFGPLCLGVVELERRFLQELPAASTKSLSEWVRRPFVLLLIPPFRRDFFQLACLGIVLVLVYCGSDWQTQPALVRWAQKLPEGATRDAMVWLADNLRIFPNAAEGLVRQ